MQPLVIQVIQAKSRDRISWNFRLKNGFSEESWVIPPEADAEFVSHQVLETYANPPEHPVMDEQPPIKETRTPIPADHPQCVDYEHERAGTASIFMEALSPFNDN